MTRAHARIFGFKAHEANKVILLRQGPSRYVQMLVWDLVTDEITPGQWMRARPFLNKCSVSPDGRYFYGVFKDHGKVSQEGKAVFREFPIWVSLSRPPYFSALANWTFTVWNGGSTPYGRWTGGKNLNLFGSKVLEDFKEKTAGTIQETNYNMSTRVVFVPEGWIAERHQVHLPPVQTTRLSQHPLFRRVQKIFLSEICPYVVKGLLLQKKIRGGMIQQVTNNLESITYFKDEKGLIIKVFKNPLISQKWADSDADGKLIFEAKGCLWRWANFPVGEPELVADLNPNKFENVPPPDWALEW